jgi:hypothetical protein
MIVSLFSVDKVNQEDSVWTIYSWRVFAFADAGISRDIEAFAKYPSNGCIVPRVRMFVQLWEAFFSRSLEPIKHCGRWPATPTPGFISISEVVQPETALAQDCQLAHFVLTIAPVVLTFPLMYDCQH